MKQKSTLFAIAILCSTTALVICQQKKPAPPPAVPIPRPAPSGILGGSLAEKLAEQGLARVLNEQLPLKLDANAVYPTVSSPPGGAFSPQALTLTVADLDRPLPPGDYSIPMFAFCTEYSVHRPGYGLAYRLGPLQGRAATAIAMLLWRGMIRNNRPPQQLQVVSWAIQSGLRYSQLPKSFQSVIDEVIPEYRSQLSGDFIQGLEDTYSGFAKGTRLPPLEQMLGKMGKKGQLALSARRQRDALLRQNTTDQIREQTLFAGQESGVYTPVRAEEGPWTERIPGVAYVRFKIFGGNMAGNNVMQVRILPPSGALASRTQNRYLVNASFASDPVIGVTAAPSASDGPQGAPTPQNLIQGSIGCAVGQGAQCLIPVPVLKPACPAGQTYHPKVNLTDIEKSMPKQCDDKTTSWPTTANFLQVTTGYISELRCNAIEFQVSCPSPQMAAHLVQFVSTQLCAADDPTRCIDGNFNVKRSDTCWQTRNLTTDPAKKSWSLDSVAPVNGSGVQDPYYDDGVGNSPRSPGKVTTTDEPSMLLGDPNFDPQITAGNFTLTKSFTDFIICGNKAIGELKWQRSSSGGKPAYTVGNVMPPNPSDVNQFRNLGKQDQYGDW